MNTISYLLSRIHREIPYEILDIGFSGNEFNRYTNLDKRIKQKIIDEILIPDLNLCSQEVVYIPLAACDIIEQTDERVILRVPPEKTNNRSLISVRNISPNNLGTYTDHNMLNEYENSTLMPSSIKMLNSNSNAMVYQTSAVELIGENTFVINEGLYVIEDLYLKAVVANDPNLNNVPPTYYDALSELAIYATQYYIYKTTVINMKVGQYGNGHTHEFIREIIGEYKDANQSYKEYYRTKWKKMAYMMNGKNMDTHIASMFGPVI